MDWWNVVTDPGAEPLLVLMAGSLIKILAINLLKKAKKPYGEVARVTSIYYYPVKSCHAIQLNEAECAYAGLHCGSTHDRQWMITDSRHVFLSGKDEHKLVLVQPSFHGKEMWLDGAGMETMKMSTEVSRNDPVVNVKVYGDTVEAVDCGKEVGDWFSRYLNKPGCHLVVRPDWVKPRHLQDGPTRWHKQTKFDDKIEFQRESPFILGSEASVEDLSTRTPDPVSMRNFRPNIVVTGCPAYDEDSWEELQIGSATFRQFKLIQRCPFTTVNPDTGKVESKEPFATLKQYRVFPEFKSISPSFCTSLVLEKPGVIHQGDIVHARRK